MAAFADARMASRAAWVLLTRPDLEPAVGQKIA